MAATSTAPLTALTTIFTPPCSITWLLTNVNPPFQYPSFPTSGPGRCYPPFWSEYMAQRGFEYYSPAICPSGFYVGPSCMITSPRTYQGFPAIQEGETAAYCVPTDHTCTSDTSDFRGGAWGVLQTATASGAQVTVGPAIQIRWRATDLNVLETNPLTPGPALGILPTFRTSDPPATELSSSSSTVTDPPTPESSSKTDSPTTEISSISDSATTESPSKTDLLPAKSSPMTHSPTSPALRNWSDATTTVTVSMPMPVSESGSQETHMGQHTGSTSADDGQRDSRGDESTLGIAIAAVVLSATFMAIILACSVLFYLRRRCCHCADKTKQYPEAMFAIRAWVRQKLSRIRWLWSRGEKGTMSGSQVLDAELGTDGPLTELGSEQPLGTRENPAELPGMAKWSWVSRFSKMFFTVRPRYKSSQSEF